MRADGLAHARTAVTESAHSNCYSSVRVRHRHAPESLLRCGAAYLAGAGLGRFGAICAIKMSAECSAVAAADSFQSRHKWHVACVRLLCGGLFIKMNSIHNVIDLMW